MLKTLPPVGYAVAEFYTGYYDAESMKESKKLPAAIQKVANKKGIQFLDAATVSKSGEDGIHFGIESEGPFAELIAGAINTHESR